MASGIAANLLKIVQPVLFHRQILQRSSALVCSPLLNYTPVCHHTRVTRRKRRSNLPEPWWPWMKHKKLDEGITDQNKGFIQEYIRDKYNPVRIFVNSTAELAESPLKDKPWPRNEWTPESRRTGLIAKKIGIYPLWLKNGKRVLCTLLQVLDNYVVSYMPPEQFIQTEGGKDFPGLARIVVGAHLDDPQNYTAAYSGLFKEAGLPPCKKLTRFLITPDAAIKPGTPLSMMHFRVGQYVSVYGKTIGRGFQGVMKRWDFEGGTSDAHGCTKSHRRIGSIGGGREKKGAWKGKHMHGHMGCERRVHSGVKIWRINTKYNVLWVSGPGIPGPCHHYNYVMDYTKDKKAFQTPPPFPSFLPEDFAGTEVQEEYLDTELHDMAQPSILYAEDEDSKSVKVKTKTTGDKTKAAKRAKI